MEVQEVAEVGVWRGGKGVESGRGDMIQANEINHLMEIQSMGSFLRFYEIAQTEVNCILRNQTQRL